MRPFFYLYFLGFNCVRDRFYRLTTSLNQLEQVL